MQFPMDENGDVLRRMADHGFDFSKPHALEFFAVFSTKEEADSVAAEYVSDHKAGDTLEQVETRPCDQGGMELQVTKSMLATHGNITAFENKLAARVAQHDGYLDGWGVLQK